MLVRPVLILSLLAAPLAHAADPALLDLLPPNATFVLGVNVRNMVSSPLVQNALNEAQASGPQFAMMMQMLGFDPMRDLDEIMLAVTGTGQNPPTLLVARGRFAKIRAASAQPKGANKMVFLDDQTMVAGDAPAVQAALRRRGATAAHGNALAVRVAAAAERYDIYGLGAIPSVPGAMPGGAADIAKMLDRFQFGLSVTNGLQLAADLETKSPESAQGMAALISTAMQSRPEASQMSKYLNLTTEGRAVHISVTMPDAEVQKLMQAASKAAAARGTLARASAPAAAAAPAPEASPAPPSRVPAGAMLMITGSDVDGGTIVVNKR